MDCPKCEIMDQKMLFERGLAAIALHVMSRTVVDDRTGNSIYYIHWTVNVGFSELVKTGLTLIGMSSAPPRNKFNKTQ